MTPREFGGSCALNIQEVGTDKQQWLALWEGGQCFTLSDPLTNISVVQHGVNRNFPTGTQTEHCALYLLPAFPVLTSVTLNIGI